MSAGDAAGSARARRIVVYGDFNCPWSYLVSRRAALLTADGLQTDWRAVEHEAAEPTTAQDAPARFEGLRREMDEVDRFLLPGELLPFALAGFLPHTGAAVEGYAEAYAAGAADVVREQLFEALWLHSFDLADPEVVHTLVVDAVRSGSSSAQQLGHWDYGTGGTGPAGTRGSRLAAQWADEWRSLGQGMVPAILVDGVHPLHGVAAVDWLGRQLLDRGLTPLTESTPEQPTLRPG
jgi:2-hydroxychromene-2-carboxylate isomerase